MAKKTKPVLIYDGKTDLERPVTQDDIRKAGVVQTRLFEVRNSLVAVACLFPNLALDFDLARVTRGRIHRDLYHKLGRLPSGEEYDAAIKAYLAGSDDIKEVELSDGRKLTVEQRLKSAG